jgi:hypothetical protein
VQVAGVYRARGSTFDAGALGWWSRADRFEGAEEEKAKALKGCSMSTFPVDRTGRILNPDGDLPCGAKDWTALLPEPVHWGGCKECSRLIKAALSARMPRTKNGTRPVQAEFDFE